MDYGYTSYSSIGRFDSKLFDLLLYHSEMSTEFLLAYWLLLFNTPKSKVKINKSQEQILKRSSYPSLRVIDITITQDHENVIIVANDKVKGERSAPPLDGKDSRTGGSEGQDKEGERNISIMLLYRYPPFQ